MRVRSVKSIFGAAIPTGGVTTAFILEFKRTENDFTRFACTSAMNQPDKAFVPYYSITSRNIIPVVMYQCAAILNVFEGVELFETSITTEICFFVNRRCGLKLRDGHHYMRSGTTTVATIVALEIQGASAFRSVGVKV